jgi:hypothetical protein
MNDIAEDNQITNVVLRAHSPLEDSQRLLRDEVGDVHRDIRALIDLAAAQRSEVSAIFNFLQKSDGRLDRIDGQPERIERRLELKD